MPVELVRVRLAHRRVVPEVREHAALGQRGQRRGELEVVEVSGHEHVAALLLQRLGLLPDAGRLVDAALGLMRLRREVVAHRRQRQVALLDVERVRRAVEQLARVEVALRRVGPCAVRSGRDQAAVGRRRAVLDQEAGRDPAPVVVGGDVARVVAERGRQAGEGVGAVGEDGDLLHGDDVRRGEPVLDRVHDRLGALVVLGLRDHVAVVLLPDREVVLDVEARHAHRVGRLGRGRRRRRGVDRAALDRRRGRAGGLRHDLVEAEAEAQRADDVADDVEEVEVDLGACCARAGADRPGCRRRRRARCRSRPACPTTAWSPRRRRSCGTGAGPWCPARRRRRGTWSCRRRWRSPRAGARACPAASGSTGGRRRPGSRTPRGRA